MFLRSFRSNQRRIVITDLTRFSNPDIVCTAGVDLADGVCIRPVPYLKTVICRRLGIVPGMILAGNFKPERHRQDPHQEDHRYGDLAAAGVCSAEEFKTALEHGLYDSLEAGFEVKLEPGQKHVPPQLAGPRSLITVAVSPDRIAVLEDHSKSEKLRVNFSDKSGKCFEYIAITDMGFHKYAAEHHARDDLRGLNNWIRSQQEVLLRLGLSRVYEAPDGRRGFWLQVNGIYTFPDPHPGIRGSQTS